MSNTSVEAFESAVARYQTAIAARAFWMGRVALYTVLRALDVEKGDRVGICAYTCLGVVEAVTRIGARPVFLDVDRQMNIAPASLERLGEPIKALIVQHTFGVPGPMNAYMEWAKTHGVPIIEDCCQAPGARWDGRLVGTMGQAAVFSLEWSKPFSTGRGGVLTLNDSNLTAKVDRIMELEGGIPGMAASWSLAIQRQAHKRLVMPATRQLMKRLYRTLRRGGTTGIEHESQPFPSESQGFLRRMPALQARAAQREFLRWQDHLAERKTQGAVLRKHLTGAGIEVLESDPRAESAPLRMAVWTGKKTEALVRAAEARIDLAGWFATPADPIRGEPLRQIGYDPKECPVAEAAFASVVTLPVFPGLAPRPLREAISILKDCR